MEQMKFLWNNRVKIPSKKNEKGPHIFSAKEFINFMMETQNENNLKREEMILYIREHLSNPHKTTRFLFPMDHTNKFKCGRHKYMLFPDYLEWLATDPNVLNLDLKTIQEKNEKLTQSFDASPTPLTEKNSSSEATYFFEKTFESMEALNNMEILVNELQFTMLRIKGQAIDPVNFNVDYQKIDQLKDFQVDFMRLSRLLPFVDLKSLILSKKVNLAFFINLYNILTIHSLVSWKNLKGKLTMTDWERTSYFNLFKYCIGGYLFSLNDIEHGLLRNEDNFGNSTMRMIFAGLFTGNFSDRSRERFDKYDGRKQLNLSRDRIGSFNLILI
jgi:hypothetical protein